jgi:hypothetical protein
MCLRVSQLTEMSKRDVHIYQLHLQRDHGLEPYFIPN